MKNGKSRTPEKSTTITSYTKDVLVAEEEQQHKRPGSLRAQLFTREQIWQWGPFLGVILLGTVLRFWGLGDKPLHHDESLHAYFSLQLMHNLENWQSCFNHTIGCYKYDPLLHGPFQFHAIALMYKLSQLLGAPDHGINTTTVRLAAALLGSVIVGLPYLLRDYLGRLGAWLTCFLLAISPSMVYYSRFAREDIYMACFTLLLVVAIGRYVRDRRGGWFVIAALAFALSYATKEATFLSIAVFGSFFVMVLIWELGGKISLRPLAHTKAWYARYIPRTGALPALCIFALLCAPLMKWFFSWMKSLSIYITKNTAASDAFVRQLKDQTLAVLPWICVALGALMVGGFVYGRLYKKSFKEQAAGRSIDPVRQPLLAMCLRIPVTHWFFALSAGAFIFVLLFSVLFTNFPSGIADGIWQGLYYWLQQQQVARGGQPWFYYLLLFPLYEQIGLVFGMIGIVRCLRRPSYFRLFLVYWFVGNLSIYSWAGEKMPWLMIHMTIPMMFLAALGLEPVVARVVNLVKHRQAATKNLYYRVQSEKRRNRQAVDSRGVFFGALVAIVLFMLTLQNMFQVVYVHYADAPHEMMIYVQTTTDVNVVMNEIDTLDQRVDGGKHQLSIGVVPDADWPFYWYLRDYTNVCYGFPAGCGDANPAVIITGGDNIEKYKSQYASSAIKGQAPAFVFHQYHLRTWWDEGYKPPACVPGTTNSCEGQPTWGGVGPLLWLSYGDNPPAQAQFDPGLAMLHIWQWWWERRAIGSTGGTTDMGFFIRSDLYQYATQLMNP